MTRDLEATLRSAMQLSTEDVRPASTIVDEMVRRGRARHRRRVAIGSAAAAAGVIAVTLLAANLVRPHGTDEPVVPGTPTPSPSVEPVPTGPERFPSSEAGLAVVSGLFEIHAEDGRWMALPPGPGGMSALRLVPVRGGWLVDYENIDLQTGDLAFLGDDGTVRAFAPAVPDAWYAASPDRTQVAALVHTEQKVYVFDLPSLTVVRTLDAPFGGLGQPTHIWFTDDRVAIQYLALGDSPGATGFVVWNVQSGARTVSPDIEVSDVAADGSVAVLNVARQLGSGSGAGIRVCLSVVEFADRLAESGEPLCDPRSKDIAVIERGALSPDGKWLAVAISPDFESTGPLTTSDIVVYRVDDLRSGATSTSVGFASHYPTGSVQFAGWYGGQAVLYEGRYPFPWVMRCDPVTGGCTEVDLPALPMAIAL